MKKLLLASFFLASGLFASAQETSQENKLVVKPSVKIFSDYHAGFGKANDINGFYVTRSFIGTKYSYGNNISGALIVDSKDPGATSSMQHTIYLRNAYVKYTSNNKAFDVSFGLINLQQFAESQNLWGNRYVAQTFQDKYKFGNSVDLGMLANYRIKENLSVDFTMTNGEGGTLNNSDNKSNYAIGLTYKPSKFVFRAFAQDHQNNVADSLHEDEMSYSFLAGYNTTKFSLGAEYNYQTSYKFKKDDNRFGLSVFGTYNINEKYSIFGQYNMLSSNKIDSAKTPWNNSNDGDLAILGFQWKINKYLRISPNVRMEIPKTPKTSGDTPTYFYMNLEFKI